MTSNRRKWLAPIGAFAIAALLFGGLPANAATGTTNWYGLVNGHSYWNVAQANGYTGLARAGTDVGASDGVLVPAGWMGATARVFVGTSLKRESGYLFTSSSVYSFGTTVDYSMHGNFYSYGVSANYNGSGNSYFYTYNSPTQTAG